MKRTISIIALIVAVCTGAWAQNRIAVSSNIANGSVTVDNANPTGAATVTLTVTPATGYYITASDITVSRTAMGAQARSNTPGIDDTTYPVTAATTDATGKGTYTFQVEAGYGAIVNATFTACAAISPQVIITGWNYGDYNAAVNTPSVEGNQGQGNVTFEYKVKDAADNTYSSDIPVNYGNYTVRATIAAAGHYLGGTATANFAIGKATLTVVAESKSMTYGDAESPLTYTADGFKNNDTKESVMTGELAREAGVNQGTYAINQGTLSAGNNYTIAFTGNTLTIARKTVSVVWSTPTTFTFDNQPHALMATVSDADLVTVGGVKDQCDVIIVVSAKDGSSLTAGKAVNVGEYTATAAALSNDNYQLPATAISQTFTITQASATLVYDNVTKTYGDAAFDVVPTTNVSGGAITLSSGNTSVITVDADGKLTIVGVGQATITASQVANGNYQATTTTFVVTVGKKTVTVSGITASPKEYDGTTTATIVTTGATFPEIVGNDVLTISGVTGTFDDKNVGTDIIVRLNYSNATLGGISAGNYLLAGTGNQTTATADITAKAVTLTWSTPTSFVFDGNSHQPTATVDASSLVAGDACTVSSYSLSGPTTEDKAVNVGEYTATATALSNGNYQLPATGISQTFTITQASATLVYDNVTKTYGDAAFDVVPTTNVSGGAITLSSGNTSVITVDADGKLTIVGVGQATITASQVANGNYQATTTTFVVTVGKKTVTVSGITAEDKEYDGNTDATVITDNAVFAGMVAGDALTISGVSGAFDDADAGTGKTVTLDYSTVTIGGASVANYLLADAGNQTTTTASIYEKELTVIADEVSKTYGDKDPELTYTYSGLIDGDVISGSLAREAGEDVGTYNISQGSLTAGNNYYIIFTGNTLTIGKKTVSVVWSTPTTFTYNGQAQAPTATVSADDIVTICGEKKECTVTVRLTAKDGSALTEGQPVNVGEYTATATSLSNDNYELPANTVQSQDFSIAKAPLTVKADDKSIDFGEAVPEFTATITGYVNGETADVLEGKLSFDCNYVEGSAAGTYTITPKGLAAKNYDITYETGTLTVTSKTIGTDDTTCTIEVSPKEFVYDGTEKKPAVTVRDGDRTVDASEYTVTYKNNVNAGTATVIITDNPGGNYTVNGTETFTIQKAPLTITADDKTRAFGEENPELTVTYTGFVNNETSAVLTKQPVVATEATVTSSVGIYDITVSGAEAMNYAITYASGKLTITSRQSDDFAVDFDSSLNDDYYVYDGKEKCPGVTVKDNGVLLVEGTDYTVSYANNINAGENTASVMVTGIGNYAGSSALTAFTIHKAPLTITADDKTREYGERNPELTVTYTGFVNNETAKVLSKLPTVTTTATADSPAGTYPITPSGAEARNYSFTYVNGTLTIIRTDNFGSGIIVRRNDTQELVPNIADLSRVKDKMLRIDRVTITVPADATDQNPVSVSVYIPATLKEYDGTEMPIYGVGRDIIVTDATVPVTDIYMPETDEAVNVAMQAFRLVKDESTTARIHTPLPLLDDYALSMGLRKEYADGHVMTTVSPTTQYWTLSTGVDVLVPEDVTAYTCMADGTATVGAVAISNTTTMVDDVERVIVKANNGVLMGNKSGMGGTFDIVAWPSPERPSGMAPPTYNAQTYEGNLMVPATVRTHFEPTQYYILYNNTFHELKPTDNTYVSPCKAVLRKANVAMGSRLTIEVGEQSSVSEELRMKDEESASAWYTLDGLKLDGRPTVKGLYIHGGRKVVVK